MSLIRKHQFALTSFCGLCAFFAVFFFAVNPPFLLLLLLCVSILLFLIKLNAEEILLYIIVSILGPLAEALSISSGVWNYAKPNLFGIPYWLPFLWGIAGIYISRLSQFLKNKLNRF